ncbi:MAG: hypothetical protein ACUVWR_18235 [Anaerolineae bacterium]
MKVRSLASMALVLVLAMSSSMSVQATEPPSFPEGAPWEEQPLGPARPGPAWQELAPAHEELAAQDTGGPDDFGYTWDDSVPFGWVDAAGEMDTGLDQYSTVAGPFPIGFAFRFYDNVHTQFWVSRYGLLGFNADIGYA